MKVLWFEISQPHRYYDDGSVTLGWQDALESVVRDCDEIELVISFQSKSNNVVKVIDGVKYIPLNIPVSFLKRQLSSFSWDVEVDYLMPLLKKVVDEEKPDLIHVFGCEWPFGLVAEVTTVPVVVHIQGSMIPYLNAWYPPCYSVLDIIINDIFCPRKLWQLWKNRCKELSRRQMEKRIWRAVENYMGRTDWDYALSNVLHPNCKYYHVEEALRSNFIFSKRKWNVPQEEKIQLITTGIGSFWKGPDMILKTAHVLSEMGVCFDWKVAGYMSPNRQNIVEKHEKMTFKDNNVSFLGFQSPSELIELLYKSTMMVHTAYIENSPNSICEAQCLGLPVVSTNVGGISTLIRDGIDGFLVPANDPWQMAYRIKTLASDRDKMKQMSEATYTFARNRHNPQNILRQILNCYHSIIDNKHGK